MTLLLISKYPILRTKVRSSCIISHTAIKSCKPNSFPALMIFYSLTWTTPAMSSFSSWKKKKKKFLSLSVFLKNATYSCWLIAFSIPWLLFTIPCILKMLLIFFSVCFSDLLSLCCSHLTCSSQRWLLSSYKVLLPSIQKLCNFTWHLFWFLLLFLHSSCMVLLLLFFTAVCCQTWILAVPLFQYNYVDFLLPP